MRSRNDSSPPLSPDESLRRAATAIDLDPENSLMQIAWADGCVRNQNQR